MPWGESIQPSIGEVPADTGLRQKTLNNKRLVAEGKEEEAKKKKFISCFDSRGRQVIK